MAVSLVLALPLKKTVSKSNINFRLHPIIATVRTWSSFPAKFTHGSPKLPFLLHNEEQILISDDEVIIGALVLQAGLGQGLEPVNKGRRLVVPGSRPIRRKLEDLGLLEVYRRAGFNIGVPGCSMCIGQGTDQAQPGEHWLSSQNRNFKHRMGPRMSTFTCPLFRSLYVPIIFSAVTTAT
jgi:hypothetical protein